ncbi:MAG: antitoxin family protein [Armatimonadota bacterium]|nr:antitoxin family protein [bacterium]MDW8321862.1 antitoxin family protein [Armatimonadota bacterium]
MASRVIEAEYDGKVLIPKEPLDLPVGKKVRLRIEVEEALQTASRFAQLWKDLASRPARGVSPDNESLRREYIYGED